MTVVKVIEVIGTSPRSWEDAAKAAVKRTCKTVQNVRGAHVIAQKAVVRGGKIVEYRAVCKIAFVVKE